jgi:hypothetical protein
VPGPNRLQRSFSWFVYKRIITLRFLKQVSAILLFLSLFAQTFNRGFILLQYQLNKSYIVAHLCENRNRPEMKCEGRCYLCKKLKKENKKDDQYPERKIGNSEEGFTFQESFSFVKKYRLSSSLRYPGFSESLATIYLDRFFHPPQS